MSVENKVLEFKTFAQMLSVLPDDKTCREYLEQVRWDNKPSCPYCACEKHYKLSVKKEFKGMYKCAACSKRYNVCIGTIFEGSHIGLRKWFIAMYIFSTNKRGVSSHQLATDLGITQKSSWYMLSRIRYIYAQDRLPESEGISMLDETFVGGKNKNRHADKKVEKSQGRSFKDKTPVFGLIRDGKVYTQVVPNTKGSTLQPIILDMVKEGTTLVTDEWTAYAGLSNKFDHKIVNHKTKQYVNEGYTTNAVENFWSHLKRGIIGVYYKTSRKHLQKYADEFSFRYNVRDLKPTERFDISLIKTERGRLKYKDLIQTKAPNL